MPNPYVIIGALVFAICSYFYGHHTGVQVTKAEWEAEKATAAIGYFLNWLKLTGSFTASVAVSTVSLTVVLVLVGVLVVVFLDVAIIFGCIV